MSVDYKKTKFYQTLMALALNHLEREFLDEQSRTYISEKGNYEHAIEMLCKYLVSIDFNMDTYIVYRVSDQQFRFFLHQYMAQLDVEEPKAAVLFAKLVRNLNDLLMKDVDVMELWPTREVRCECGAACHLIRAEMAYSHSAVVQQNLKGRYYYRCPVCGAMVGTHAGTNIPLGKPVNKITAEMRQKTHKQIEEILKNDDQVEKTDAYNYLSAKMPGWKKGEIHVGNFDANACVEAMKVLETFQEVPRQVKLA